MAPDHTHNPAYFQLLRHIYHSGLPLGLMKQLQLLLIEKNSFSFWHLKNCLLSSKSLLCTFESVFMKYLLTDISRSLEYVRVIPVWLLSTILT